MRKNRNLRFLVLGAVVAVGVGAAVASAGPPSKKGHKQPLVIAVEGPQSGNQASNGLDMLRGVRLAVEQLNAHGGLWNGRKVVVYAADDKGDAANAAAVARKVIARRIRFVIGPYNSSVGLANLSIYRRNKVLPLWMTSLDETAGAGATLQPMNSQIAPVEARYAEGRLHVRKVAMLVDETPNGAFTSGMASRLQAALEADGTSVTRVPIEETKTVGVGYYTGKVAEALRTNPDLVYVSTYFPEGIEIAKALTAAGATPPCLMGLANVDNAFVESTTLAQAQRCVFSGVPAAGQMPSAGAYVSAYRMAFHVTPGVWGTFTYDSAKVLFSAINRAKAPRFVPVLKKLRATRNFPGATGRVTIDPKTGYRVDPPVSILRVDSTGTFVIAAGSG